MFSLQDYLEKMHVEEIDTLLFRGQALQMGLSRVFGGQVVGQALNAAVRTVEPERKPHSFHSYFLRPGDLSRPIIYEVDPIRDGRSFSTRRVVAKQGGEAIFNASISFHLVEEGVEHQMDMPKGIPMPETLMSDLDMAEKMAQDIDGLTLDTFRSYTLLFDKELVDMRTPKLMQTVKTGAYAPEYGFWFKFNPAIGDDPIAHRTALAFISDKALMSTGLQPHSLNHKTHRLIGASLDHALWFHEKIDVNQWLYYHLDSPRSAGNRAYNRGAFYTKQGVLIASSAQEGLIRIVPRK